MREDVSTVSLVYKSDYYYYCLWYSKIGCKKEISFYNNIRMFSSNINKYIAAAIAIFVNYGAKYIPGTKIKIA